MLIKLNLIKTAALVLTLLAVPAKSSNTHRVEQQFSKINMHMEILYEALRVENAAQACEEASKAASLIKDNFDKLKSIEPDYNWTEIRKVLLGVTSKYCQ